MRGGNSSSARRVKVQSELLQESERGSGLRAYVGGILRQWRDNFKAAKNHPHLLFKVFVGSDFLVQGRLLCLS